MDHMNGNQDNHQHSLGNTKALHGTAVFKRLTGMHRVEKGKACLEELEEHVSGPIIQQCFQIYQRPQLLGHASLQGMLKHRPNSEMPLND